MPFHDIESPEPEKGGRKTPAVSLWLKRGDRGEEKSARLIRGLAIFLCVGLVLFAAVNLLHLSQSGLRFKAGMAKAANDAFEYVLAGALAVSDGQFERAGNLFAEAREAFQNIEYDAWFASRRYAGEALEDPLFAAGNSLLLTGRLLAEAGENFSNVARNLHPLPGLFFEGNGKKSLATRPSLTEKLKKEIPAIEQTAGLLSQAYHELSLVPEHLVPREVRDRFRFARDVLGNFSTTLDDLRMNIPAILALLGDKEPHTILVLLQNNAELRPSGGFIGSYMIVETNDGYITKNEVFDVYQTDHQLAEAVAPPPEIEPVNKRWFLRDSNYSPHFPLSAAKAAWFLEKARGPGVDSVIAVDTEFVAGLLQLTGPVRIADLAQPLTAENYAPVISYIVESKLSGRENPKIILKHFLDGFEKSLFGKTDPAALLPFFRSAIERKHLLAYSKDPAVQEFFARIDIDGAIKTSEPKEDFLTISHTSIGGNKSDAYMEESIAHDTYIKQDGRLIDEVTITRRHTWDDKKEEALAALFNSFGFTEISRDVMAILGGSRNLHMLRIYVPAGSKLIESSDPEVSTHKDAELGKTYFSARMETPINQPKNLRIRYELPFELDFDPAATYRLAAQKQAGQDRVTFVKRIFPESGVRNFTYFPEAGAFDTDGVWSLETEFAKDAVFSSVWGG